MPSLNTFLRIAVCGLLAQYGLAQAFEAAPPPGENQALVYVYRERHLPFAALMAVIKANGERIAQISNGEYAWVHMPAGAYTLEHVWYPERKLYRPVNLPVNWEAGKTYYYRFLTNQELLSKMKRVGEASIYTLSYDLLPEDEAQAVPFLRNASYQSLQAVDKQIERSLLLEKAAQARQKD